ncbi:hypothetical protein CK203_057633 [Vitis vinifera]|uniref:CCHC-type domain-containing protein n=1 Tax=Vitis vinifera TaxID=29760 RepID=A0A438GNH7_VITVI|nr:hypothetical protein CK203_057633 [Vitis vinifera]
MVMHPPSFNGEPNAEAAEHWLRRMRRILVGLDIPEERRVGLAAYMLVDKADFWWESMKRVYDTEVMTWEEFERIFLGKYFGEVAKHAKRMDEEGEKARRFQQGILRRPTKFRSKGGIEREQRMGESSQGRSQGPQQRQRTQQSERHSSFYAGGEQSAQRVAANRVCYGCGARDHLWRACPLRGVQQARPQSQGSSQQQPVCLFQPPQFQLPLLPDATITPNSAGNQDSYYE